MDNFSNTLRIATASVFVLLMAIAPALGGMTEKGNMVAEEMAGEHMAGHKSGSFTGIGSHNATGKVMVGKGVQGGELLTITGMTVDEVPDGRVYLAKEFDYDNAFELGKLKSFSGTATFPIPASVDLGKYDSVLIWCKKFNVGIGQAKLE